MKTVIIKYNAGNIRSVTFALERLGVVPVISDDTAEIMSADNVIFPGVGEAGSAMKYLRSQNMDQVIRSLKQPVLGICLGMQLLCDYSEEGDTKCIGIFDQKIKKFQGNFKVPQVGWNTIFDVKDDLFKGVDENEYMYFVHGYYAELSAYTIAKADYGGEYSAALRKDNFYGVQFHPEKSCAAGQKILENFLTLNP